MSAFLQILKPLLQKLVSSVTAGALLLHKALQEAESITDGRGERGHTALGLEEAVQKRQVVELDKLCERMTGNKSPRIRRRVATTAAKGGGAAAAPASTASGEAGDSIAVEEEGQP